MCIVQLEWVAFLKSYLEDSTQPTPPPAHAQAHETQAQAHAHDAQAQTQSALCLAGSWEALADGGGGIIALANFSMLATILPDVFSIDVAMLFAKSAPGIVGGLEDCVGIFTFGVYAGLGLYIV
jgi:hypothetical protein